MSLKLTDRDYVPDGNGGVAVAQDGDEVLGEALFRLTARRGAFPFLPSLGSRMYLLRRARPSEWDSLALRYAVEALEDMEGVQVTGAAVDRKKDGLHVTVELLWQGRVLPLEVSLEG